MIKVTGNISIPKIQNLYSELAASNDAVIDVHLPKKIEKRDFGLLFSYLQFLATWVRNNRSGKLHLPVNSTQETIEYLDNNEFVYPSIVLAWEKEIVNSSGENIKSELKNPSKEYFNRMDFFDLKRTSVPIYCFDHDKSNRGLSRHLYKNFRELVNETTLGFNLFNAFKKVGDFNKANKYLTGFDQPKLTAMYVDKKLQGVLAVQALSRLNRSANKLGKKTEDLFVLDFFNSTEDIKNSFDPFYTSTTLSKATDVNVLHELKAHLDELGVYEWSEVEDFTAKYFEGLDADKFLSPILQIAEERFNSELELEEEIKIDYKIKAKQFVKIYGQMASIMPYEMVKWEKLFWFLKFLIPKMVIKDPERDALDELLNTVDLSTYGLERVKLGANIGLDPTETEMDPQNPNPRGAHGGDKEENPLDMIIQAFNERWFQGWEATPDEQRVKFVSLAQHIKAHPDYKEKFSENTDTINREIAFGQIFNEVMAKQRKNELELYRLIAKDDAFKVAMMDTLKRVLGAV